MRISGELHDSVLQQITLSYSKAGQGKESGVTRFGSQGDGEWFATGTDQDRNRHPSDVS